MSLQARKTPDTQPVQQTGSTGAVLIFLQGWDAIAKVRETLSDPASPFSSRAYAILPLHSQLPSAEQRLVFISSRQGVRKIVLATNMAESAVTIPGAFLCIVIGGCRCST